MNPYDQDPVRAAFMRYVQHDNECRVTGSTCEGKPWRTYAGVAIPGCSCARKVAEDINAAAAASMGLDGSLP